MTRHIGKPLYYWSSLPLLFALYLFVLFFLWIDHDHDRIFEYERSLYIHIENVEIVLKVVEIMHLFAIYFDVSSRHMNSSIWRIANSTTNLLLGS